MGGPLRRILPRELQVLRGVRPAARCGEAAAASRKLVAYVSVSTGPDIGKWLYGKDPVKKALNDKLIFDAHAMLPAGVPKLFIAGSKDNDITPIPMMKSMLERVPMPRVLEEIEGMNHGTVAS